MQPLNQVRPPHRSRFGLLRVQPRPIFMPKGGSSCRLRCLETYGGLYFVCDHGKHRNAKRYNIVCNFVQGGETRVTPKTVPFSKTNLTNYITELREQSRNPHIANAVSEWQWPQGAESTCEAYIYIYILYNNTHYHYYCYHYQY